MLMEMMKQKEDNSRSKEHGKDKVEQAKDKDKFEIKEKVDKLPVSKDKSERISESSSAKEVNRPKPIIVKPTIPKELLAKEQEIIFTESEAVKSMSNS